MAAPTLCLFNKFGYCKFSERCIRHHVNEICVSNHCNISECRKRHPKLCKYFENYRRCKFNPCAYRHEKDSSKTYDEVEERNLKEINDKMSVIENEIIKKNERIEELVSKISSLESKIKEIDTFKEKINDIQVKIQAHEKKFDDIFEAIDKGFDFLKEKVEIFEENIDDLAVELNDDIGNLTIESEDNSLGQTFKNPFLEGSKCDLCDFTAKSERGLKTHKLRKHWPCEWCALICKDQSDLKKHKMDEHTLKYSAEVLRGYVGKSP